MLDHHQILMDLLERKKGLEWHITVAAEHVREQWLKPELRDIEKEIEFHKKLLEVDRDT